MQAVKPDFLGRAIFCGWLFWRIFLADFSGGFFWWVFWRVDFLVFFRGRVDFFADFSPHVQKMF